MTTLEIVKGSTFSVPLQWEDDRIVYKPISAITKSAPMVISALLHGVPDGWRVAIVSVKGMKEINSELDAKGRPKTYHSATILTGDTIELNSVNSADFTAYMSGGYVQYNAPVDLTGFIARMNIKDKVGGTLLLSLTTLNGGIVIDNVTKTITLVISAAATAALPWKKGVFDLEMESTSGIVTKLVSNGQVTVSDEVTT